MEEFETLIEEHKNGLTKEKLKDYNSLSFAFIGDSIHTFFIRSYFVLKSNAKAGKLHILTSKFVNATMQAKAMDALMIELSEEELQIVKTARNVKNKTSAKHAELEDYKKATGFEAIIGYLYLTGQTIRMNELLNKSLKIMEKL